MDLLRSNHEFQLYSVFISCYIFSFCRGKNLEVIPPIILSNIIKETMK